MKQFCTKIDLISQERENVLFLASNMAAVTSHENALYAFPCQCLAKLPFHVKPTKFETRDGLHINQQFFSSQSAPGTKGEKHV